MLSHMIYKPISSADRNSSKIKKQEIKAFPLQTRITSFMWLPTASSSRWRYWCTWLTIVWALCISAKC